MYIVLCTDPCVESVIVVDTKEQALELGQDMVGLSFVVDFDELDILYAEVDQTMPQEEIESLERMLNRYNVFVVKLGELGFTTVYSKINDEPKV